MKNVREVPRDGDTRAAVISLLMSRGQATASDIGTELKITTTAVRRHLDNLLEAGDVTVVSSTSVHRGRGRPAKEFVLTPIGRRRLGQGYDALAVDALRALREVGGETAVRDFARRRAERAIGGAERVVADAARTSQPEHRDEPVQRARMIAEALSAAGFSADAREVGNGVQICQHHCPVSDVAAEFPELCEAEIAAIEGALGTHVQRLATIANGDRACTTHVPLEYLGAPANKATPVKELR